MFARVVNLVLLIALLIAIPLSHAALSAKKKAAKKKAGPAPKVAICHFPEHFPEDSTVGHVIEVSANAVPAHVSKHGDCTAFLARPNGACRCMTCEEQCQATAERCRANCDPDDANCLDECQVALGRCNAACETPNGG